MDNFFKIDDQEKQQMHEARERLNKTVEYYNKLTDKKSKNDVTEEIKELVNEIFGHYFSIQILEALLSHYKQKKQELIIKEIPSLLSELGMKKCVLADGTEVLIKEEVTTKVVDEQSLNWWLETNGHKDELTNTFIFKKGEVDEKLYSFLSENKYNFSYSNKVHHQTLQRIMRERHKKKIDNEKRKNEGKEVTKQDEKWAEFPPENIAEISIFEMAKINKE